ncbi:hypothetical protein FA048_01650 [Pedobacter polaris]|uniref:Uncharacterized protein n=1 Tax=Pedobacter polaris TaxID=2571273 RepID=A0A4U1CVZ1_9SPHI|nr:hypothetical protein [Pedobacter polaris]TKC12350.1 hypothetical protein FA048_01650 [Pedobacter polaris]
MKREILMLLVLLSFATVTLAQNSRNDLAVALIDGEKTANSKDILTNLFRASIDNLLGKDRTYSLNSSFLGFYEIFHKKQELPYERLRVLKQNSFNLGLTGGDQNNITKISTGFTFSVINDTDIKSEKKMGEEFSKLDHDVDIYITLYRQVLSYLQRIDTTLKSDVFKIQSLNKSWSDASNKHDFSNLSPQIELALKNADFIKSLRSDANITTLELQGAIREVLSGKDILYEEYQRIAKIYAQKLLWTLAPSVNYDRVNKQGEYILGSNLTFGLWKKTAQKPWEFEIKTQFKIANDSTLTQSNYNDKPLSLSVGLNKVLLKNKEKESAMELKVFTQYNHQFGSTPSLQREDIFTFNTTLRVNVYKSFWLPLTLKYDVKNGNLLGLFTLTANLDK